MAKRFLHVITTYTTTCHPCALLMQITSFMCFIDANNMSFMCFLDASKKHHEKPKYYTNSGVFGKFTKLFVSCSNSKLIQLFSTSQIGDGENTVHQGGHSYFWIKVWKNLGTFRRFSTWTLREINQKQQKLNQHFRRN